MELIRTDRVDADPRQPRRELGDLTDLEQSLREVGFLINPIHVVPAEDRFVLLCGARRLAAAITLGWTEIAATIHPSHLTEPERLAIQRAENDGRRDLTLSETATALARHLASLDTTPTEYARSRGLDETRITRLAALANATDLTRVALDENLLRCPRAAALFARLSHEAQRQLIANARNTDRPISRVVAEQARRRADEATTLPDRIRIEFDPDAWQTLLTIYHLPTDACPADARAAILRGQQ